MADRQGDLRLLTFDLDDTLWPCAPVIYAAERGLYAWLQRHAPRVTEANTVESMRAHRLAIARAHPDQAHDLTWLRAYALRDLLRRHEHDEALADAATELFREARDRVEPYDEVVEAFTRLRRRYLLVSVTNGNARVENTPLDGLFHHSLSAAQVGAAKPHPALFEASLAFAEVAPSAALHVGDDAWLDVAAARALGMRTAWVDRSNQGWSADLPAPDFTVRDLAALEAQLMAADADPDGHE